MPLVDGKLPSRERRNTKGRADDWRVEQVGELLIDLSGGPWPGTTETIGSPR